MKSTEISKRRPRAPFRLPKKKKRAGRSPARDASPKARFSLRDDGPKTIAPSTYFFFFGAAAVLAAATLAARRDFLRRHALRWRCLFDLRLSPRPMVASPRRSVNQLILVPVIFRNASRPILSIVRIADAAMRSVTKRLRESDQKRFFWRFGRKRWRVLMFECETR